jgi:hypothetical protein
MNPVLHQASSRLNKAAADLLLHVQTVESGQGKTPLGDLVHSLSTPAQMGAPLAVCLLGLSANAVAKTLSLWLGADYFSCRGLIPSRTPWVEINAGPGSPWQGRLAGVDSRFESAAALAEAVEACEKSAAAPPSALERLALHVPLPPGSSPLRLLIPSGVESLRRHPSLVSCLGDQAKLVIMAGHSDGNLDAADSAILQPLVSSTGVLRCLVLPAAAHAPGAFPTWVRELQAPVVLPAIIFDQSNADTLIGSLEDHMAVMELARMRQLEGVVQLLEDAVQMENTSLANRKRLLDPGRPQGAAAGDPANPRYATAEVTRSFQQDIEDLRCNRDEQALRSIHPGGHLYEVMETLVGATTLDDLRQEWQPQVIALSLGADTLDRLRQVVRQELDHTLREDLAILRDAIRIGLDSVSDSLGGRTGLSHPLHVPPPDFDRMSAGLAALVQLNVRFKGELPRSTWKARFHSARNSMMAISMFLMLTTAVSALFNDKELGNSLRNGLMILMLFAFVGGLLYSIFGYRRLRAEAAVKEMVKFRENVMQELQRLVASLVGEKRRLIAEYLTKSAREMELGVAAIFQSLSDIQRAEVERSRMANAEKTRILDIRNRALAVCQQAGRQVNLELNNIRLLLSQVLQESVKPVISEVGAASPLPPRAAPVIAGPRPSSHITR